MNKLEKMLKTNAFLQKLYIIIFSFIFKFLGIFIPTRQKQVLFQSLKGKNYGDSPLAIYNYMQNDPFFKDFSFVWAFDNPEKYNIKDAKVIKFSGIKYFLTALQSGVWITNVNIERGLQFKKRDTIYVNTWHGCGPLKIDGNQQKGRNDYDYSNVDIMCSCSDWQDSCFINSMKVKKESIIRCGMPRNDELFNTSEENIKGLKEKYGINPLKKVILYAPTWRDNNNLVIPLNFKRVKKELGDSYCILFRAHHLVANKMNIEFDDFCMDFSGQYNVNELMLISDILITDYSSILSDFSLLEKPIVLFAYDYEQYKKDRGLYSDLNILFPGNVCEDEESLIKKIKTLNYDAESEKSRAYKNKYTFPLPSSTALCVETLKKSIIARGNKA